MFTTISGLQSLISRNTTVCSQQAFVLTRWWWSGGLAHNEIVIEHQLHRDERLAGEQGVEPAHRRDPHLVVRPVDRGEWRAGLRAGSDVVEADQADVLGHAQS